LCHAALWQLCRRLSRLLAIMLFYDYPLLVTDYLHCLP
jgi:hypothetical protein